jgi:hypothetical protein
MSDVNSTAADEEKYGHLRSWCSRLGFVHFEGHTFVFKQPNAEHGRFMRRASVNPASHPDAQDDIAKQLIVAVDDIIAPDLPGSVAPRLAFGKWLETRPLATDNAWFGPVLAELFGQVEEGSAEAAGKGCRVSSAPPATSLPE